MRKEQELHKQRPQPALIVTCGNATLKSRALDRDILVLGRAPGCDLRLMSPEVAPTHCVIVRVAEGWRVRDCSGRSGTWVNGKAVRDEALHDGDTLQVGTFGFQAQLPRDEAGEPATGPKVERLERSRRNLARLALDLRRRVHTDGGARDELEELLAQRQAEVGRQVEELRGLQRDFEARRVQLLEAERRLAADRAALDQEATTLKACRDQAEQSPAPGARAEEARHLDLRGQELGHFARHLRRLRERLGAQLNQAERHGEEMRQAAREAELQMSRERALIAQERAQLQRLREEIRQEREGNRRDDGPAADKSLKEEPAERGRAEAQIQEQGHPPQGPRWRHLPGRLAEGAPAGAGPRRRLGETETSAAGA
jgi:pSer/pThr/pTyr-binding forkhead associated (FHA) protein